MTILFIFTYSYASSLAPTFQRAPTGVYVNPTQIMQNGAAHGLASRYTVYTDEMGRWHTESSYGTTRMLMTINKQSL